MLKIGALAEEEKPSRRQRQLFFVVGAGALVEEDLVIPAVLQLSPRGLLPSLLSHATAGCFFANSPVWIPGGFWAFEGEFLIC